MTLIDPYKPITSNWFFWCLAGLPVLVGLILGFIGWSAMEMETIWTPEGYNRFLAASALPIGIMGIGFPLGGIYGLVHRSKQASMQLLKEKLRELHGKNMEYVKSTDAMIVHLKRINNHTALLNRWIQKSERGEEPIKRKLESIMESWSAFYTDARFFPAMTRLDEKFAEMDAIMCGYEHGISDYILPGKHEATGDGLATYILKLSDLEKGIREYRSTLEQVYLSEAEELVGFYGFKP